jgi:hypothetical protein
VGQAAYDHFVTKCELFEVGVTLFAKAFIGKLFGQYRSTLQEQARMIDIKCCATV